VLMRLILWVILALSLVPVAARAQATQVGVRGGLLSYDAGGDQSYPMLQITAERTVAPHLRLGVLGSWAHVGEVSRPWVRAGSDERVFRGVATAGYEAARLFAGVPVLKHLTPVFSAGLGVVHSAGVETDFSQYQNDPFFGITNQRTGFTYGGGLTLELPVVSRAIVSGTFQYWRDKLYGGRLDNFDQALGVAWRF
jgi:opacity protein-like surface antigen